MEAGDSNYTSSTNNITYDSHQVSKENDGKSEVSKYHSATEIADVKSNSSIITRSSNDLTLDGLELLKVFNEFVTRNIDGAQTSADWLTSLIEDGLQKCSMNSEINLQKQLQLCHKQLGQFSKLIKDITIRLREHKCIGAYDPIKPLFVLLEDIRFQQHEIIHSANRLGMLKYENCTSKFWSTFCLNMSHLKIIPKDVEQLTVSAGGDLQSPENLNTNSKDSIKVIKSNESHGSRFICCVKKAVIAILISLLLIILIIMFLYIYCTISNDGQICNEFIEVVSVGIPPN